MLPLGFASFLAFGVVLVLVGASQSELAAALKLDLAGTGLLGSLLVGGIGVGVFAAGPLADRDSRRALYVGACLLTALAALGVSNEMGLARACVHMALIGLGAGVYETVLNAEIISGRGESAPRSITVIHAGATLGAMLAPLAIEVLVSGRGHGFSPSFRAVGAMHVVLAAWALTLSFGGSSGAARRGLDVDATSPVGATDSGDVRRPLPRAVWWLALACFAYVGLESTLTLFALPWSMEVLGLDAGRGRAAISAFWLGLLVGRLGVATLRHAPSARWLSTSGLIAAALVAVLVVCQPATPELALGALGLVLGGVFPLLISISGLAAGEGVGRAVGLVAGCGSIGGFVVPWLTGILAEGSDLARALGTLTFWCLLLALGAALAKRGRGPAGSSTR